MSLTDYRASSKGMVLATSVVGSHSRPRCRHLRQSKTGFQPWSRRRRTRPISLDPFTGAERVGQRAKTRAASPPHQLG